MNLTEAQVKALLLFGDHLQLKHTGLNLLVARLKTLYKKEPSPQSLHYCFQELNSFISKYEILITYDLTLISSLKEI